MRGFYLGLGRVDDQELCLDRIEGQVALACGPEIKYTYPLPFGRLTLNPPFESRAPTGLDLLHAAVGDGDRQGPQAETIPNQGSRALMTKLTCRGSAVAKPNFASKYMYSVCSIAF